MLSLLILIHVISLLDTTKKKNTYHHFNEKRSLILPSQYCMYSHIQLRNEFLFQDSRHSHIKNWSIISIAYFHFLALTKHLIKWLLWYFLHTSHSALFLFENCFLRRISTLFNLSLSCIDFHLDFIDNLGDMFPVLSRITLFNFEELIELFLALAFYSYLGFSYIRSTTLHGLIFARDLLCKKIYTILMSPSFTNVIQRFSQSATLGSHDSIISFSTNSYGYIGSAMFYYIKSLLNFLRSYLPNSNESIVEKFKTLKQALIKQN